MPEYPDVSFCFLKIRVNFDTEDQVEELLEILTEYIRFTKVEFTTYTSGTHYKCDRKHFHYHIILNTDIKNIPTQFKNPNYHFKKKFILEKKGLKDWPTYSMKAESLYVDELQPDIETATNKFLRYPLKEGNPIRNYCSISTLQLDGMIETAKEEFRFAEEQKIKTEQEQRIKITKWNEIKEYLDNQVVDEGNLWDNPSDVWYCVAKKMRQDTIPPTLKAIDTMTERYLLSRSDEFLYEMCRKRTQHLGRN